MNLDELRAVQDREREKDSLQHLRDSFYEEVGSYIADLRAERERRADQAEDPFADPEVRRLTDEIETAEEVAESLYERRMGKVVKTASLAAAGYTTDTEGLTGEEDELFDDLVDRIEHNQDTVLDVLSGRNVGGRRDGDGEASEVATDQPSDAVGEQSAELTAESPPEPGTEPDSSGGVGGGTGIDADGDSAAAVGDAPTPTDPVEHSTTDGAAASGGEGGDRPSDDTDRPAAEAAAIASDAGSEDDATDVTGTDGGDADGGLDAAAVMGDLDRVTVQITDDVGEIVGVDGTAYDLVSEDVVTLPEENAEPLVEKDAARRVE